ncbi:PAS domain-containing protein [Minwuia sp.]|uniref:PAS domain-containing protein n=1 Tax=Minwuia sp. TaxID=2493630 RepID=UPI003A918B8F
MVATPSRFATLMPSRHTEIDLSEIGQYPMLKAMVDFWQQASGESLPRRIEPFDVPKKLMPYVMLLDLETEPECLRVRLAGTEVCAKHGGELRSKTTNDFFLEDDAQAVVDAAKLAASTRKPTLARREYVGLDDRMWGYVRLILPLSSDGVKVDRFFKAIEPATLREFRAASRG